MVIRSVFVKGDWKARNGYIRDRSLTHGITDRSSHFYGLSTRSHTSRRTVSKMYHCLHVRVDVQNVPRGKIFVPFFTERVV